MTHNKMDKLMKIYSEKFINILLKQLDYKESIKFTCPNELIIKSNKYEADFVGYTNKNEILNIEFQSTKITEKDKSRFTKYAILLKDKYKTNIKTVVISTANKEKERVIYKINEESQHIINLEVLTTLNGDKLYNNIKNKHKSKKKLTREDIANLSLIPLMQTKEPVDKVILKICKLTNDLKIKQEDLDYLKQSQKILTERYVKKDEMKKLIQDEIKMVTDLFKWVDKETKAELLKKGEIIGEKRGIKKGEKRGEKRGIKKGEKRGEKRGIKKGEKRGIKKEKKRMITKMLKENMKIEEIMKYTNLSKKEIQNIEKQIYAK